MKKALRNESGCIHSHNSFGSECRKLSPDLIENYVKKFSQIYIKK
jgi:hypothetical protein